MVVINPALVSALCGWVHGLDSIVAFVPFAAGQPLGLLGVTF
jgi:hypothetical protein